jgi:hypothetical protein
MLCVVFSFALLCSLYDVPLNACLYHFFAKALHSPPSPAWVAAVEGAETACPQKFTPPNYPTIIPFTDLYYYVILSYYPLLLLLPTHLQGW